MTGVCSSVTKTNVLIKVLIKSKIDMGGTVCKYIWLTLKESMTSVFSSKSVPSYPQPVFSFPVGVLLGNSEQGKFLPMWVSTSLQTYVISFMNKLIKLNKTA